MKTLVVFTRITLLLVALLLVLQSTLLMTQGMLHLGITLPLVLGLLGLYLALRWRQVQNWLDAEHAGSSIPVRVGEGAGLGGVALLRPKRPGLRRRWWNWLWIGFGLWMLSLAWYFWHLSTLTHDASAYSQTGRVASTSIAPIAPIAAIVVLGSGAPGGVVSPTLKSRLDLAARYAKQHPLAWVVVSGGQGMYEPRSEADVMGDYLIQQGGVAPERLLRETRSSSTEENFAFSAPLLRSKGVELQQPIVVVTNDFHGSRSLRIAQKQGYKQVKLALSPMPIALRYNAWLREYFAQISSYILREV